MSHFLFSVLACCVNFIDTLHYRHYHTTILMLRSESGGRLGATTGGPTEVVQLAVLCRAAILNGATAQAATPFMGASLQVRAALAGSHELCMEK